MSIRAQRKKKHNKWTNTINKAKNKQAIQLIKNISSFIKKVSKEEEIEQNSLEDRLIAEDIQVTIKLDYSLQSPLERVQLVKKIISNTSSDKLTNKYIEILTDYIVLAMSKEERKQKISESVSKSWKEGKLKDRKETAQCWSIPCYIYDITNWTMCKACSSFKEAGSFIGLNDFEVRSGTI